jgi:hypothetical protein
MNRYRLGLRAHFVTGDADPCSVLPLVGVFLWRTLTRPEPKTTAAAPMQGIAQGAPTVPAGVRRPITRVH